MSSVDEQVIDFYYELFDRIFTQPFRPRIKDRLRQDAVARQVQEAAGAASQALTRFFLSEQLTDSHVAEILRGFTSLHEFVKLEDIANPNRTPEALVEELLKVQPCPTIVSKAGSAAVYRVALHLTVQVLMLVGPVMTEWQRLSFSSTYEMPRRIVTQLNQITEGLKVFAGAGQAAADERYELAYRDHLLQRFYRVEAGTVRMTTNLNVDLRELFVMPRVTVRPKRKSGEGRGELEALMNLSAARAVFGEGDKSEDQSNSDQKTQAGPAIEQVERSQRSVVVGVPGGGKSTFFEWLQLSVANVDIRLISGGGQAIPLLLRVRQLDPYKLPRGAALIEKATASRDRATLMPEGWIHRQMKSGRVLFMLDGLDETEPSIRDDYILPWLADLCKEYPDCLYLVSSRPVGYPPGALRKMRFAECDLQDFRNQEITEFTRHWCTSIRLAQNEPDQEARREGAKEGDQIVEGFKDHPYIRNLARNPLMLSAICLVNYFEGGELPKDRALLYKLCVEGLLHHWDQRRGIRSEYPLDEKLRVSREVAIAMQADDRAEYEAAKVLKVFAEVLKDKDRAKRLLEHIRYRTGLLIERRAGVFAFAHLTFQEYLAARAVYEENSLGIDSNQMASEHADGRWNEVIALFCGSASTAAARKMIESLVKQSDTEQLATVLAEAFLSSNSELSQDVKLRKKVLERIAVAPQTSRSKKGALKRFSDEEVAPIANSCVGKIGSDFASEAYRWLFENPKRIEDRKVVSRLRGWRKLNSMQLGEVVHLTHSQGTDDLLVKVSSLLDMYKVAGPKFQKGPHYESQAEVALLGLGERLHRNQRKYLASGAEKALLQSFRVLSQQPKLGRWSLQRLFSNELPLPKKNFETVAEFLDLARQIENRIEKLTTRHGNQPENTVPHVYDKVVDGLRNWAARLDAAMKTKMKKDVKLASKEKTTSRRRGALSKPAAKKQTKRRVRG
jgi:NACHT domain